MREIPLFPLNVVLFPGMPLQLHIFEERYQRMLKDCQVKDSQFGVVLIRQGKEAHGPLALPYSVGCVAEVTSIEQIDEGRYNLWVVGRKRFQIQELRRHRPYLVGLIQDFPLRVEDTLELTNHSESLRPWLARYLKTLGNDQEIESLIQEIPSDPVELAYVCAVLLQIPPVQKQSLLETRDCLIFLSKLEKIYHREVILAEKLQKRPVPEPQGSFSLN